MLEQALQLESVWRVLQAQPTTSGWEKFISWIVCWTAERPGSVRLRFYTLMHDRWWLRERLADAPCRRTHTTSLHLSTCLLHAQQSLELLSGDTRMVHAL